MNQKMMSSKIFRYFASVRFALQVLVLFTVAMSWGTIAESIFGTVFAARNVYFSWWFFALQGLIMVSLIFAVIVRLPFRKNLSGFYLVHLSLVTILLGSIITRFWGVDGQIQLLPGQPTDTIRLSQDVLYLSWDKLEKPIKLPDSGKITKLDEVLIIEGDKKVILKTYLPFASVQENWEKGGDAWVTKWVVGNGKEAASFELSNERIGNLQSEKNMGSVTFKVVSNKDFEALKQSLKKGKTFLVKDVKRNKEYPIATLPNTIKLPVGNLQVEAKSNPSLGLIAYILTAPEGLFKFFPSFSQFPIIDHLKVDQSSPYQFFDLGNKAEAPTVIISRYANGKIYLAYGNGDNWSFDEYLGKALSLPWMELQLSLMKERVGEKIVYAFSPVTPKKNDQSLAKAVELELSSPSEKKTLWLSNRDETHDDWGTNHIGGFIGQETITLPYQMTLQEFKMDKNPGTMNAASYESFVKMSDSQNPVHIFMNNPFSRDGYTFYQASYFQDQSGQYASVLSANKDPGRMIKYIGSLLLVLGFLLHYLIHFGYLKLKGNKK